LGAKSSHQHFFYWCLFASEEPAKKISPAPIFSNSKSTPMRVPFITALPPKTLFYIVVYHKTFLKLKLPNKQKSLVFAAGQQRLLSYGLQVKKSCGEKKVILLQYIVTFVH
jgi:hypothetical protein